VNAVNCMGVCARSGDELDHLVDEVACQLKKQAITGSRQKDRIMLGVDVGRLGYVNRGNLRDMCVNHQLPCDDDVVDSVSSAFLIVYRHCVVYTNKDASLQQRCIIYVRNMNSNQADVLVAVVIEADTWNEVKARFLQLAESQ